jgi:hypothetical protein
MPNFLSQLTTGEQARLLEELNYMKATKDTDAQLAVLWPPVHGED